MLTVAGVSHKTAPLAVRERMAIANEELRDLLPSLRDRFGPVVVLSTCNRTEVYVGGRDAAERGATVAAAVAEMRGLPTATRDDHFYTLHGHDAVRHLFRVAAGLESMVVGEAQILGQVRGALHAAQRANATDSMLVRLFQSAVGAGRRLRGRGAVAGSVASVSSAAVELAARSAGDLSGRSVLVVSTGKAGALAARTLVERGAGRILIAGRTLARAERLAADVGATAVPFQLLPSALRDADVAISATGTRGFQIDVPMVADAMAKRPDRPLLLIDLAVPRDVDPAVRSVRNVAVHDIDALQPMMLGENPQTPDAGRSIDAALDEEVSSFMSWSQTRWVVPTISALRGQAENIRRMELSKTLRRLPNLSAEERQRVDALTTAIVNKLLHQPIMCLRESEGEPAYVEAVRELFALPSGLE